MEHLLLAAAKGDPNSQFTVGVVCDNGLDDNGHGVRRKRGEAIKWLLKAARQGLPRAQSKLAEVYSDGTGRPGDCVMACAWFLVATANSAGVYRERAQSGFERVSSNMTPAEIAKARHFAGAWRPKDDEEQAASGRENAQ